MRMGSQFAFDGEANVATRSVGRSAARANAGSSAAESTDSTNAAIVARVLDPVIFEYIVYLKTPGRSFRRSGG